MSEVNSEKAIPVTKKEIFGWAMFDFSNSAYTTVVTTAIYAGFFTEFIVDEGSSLRDTYWSLSIMISTIIALFLSPLVGAICDLQADKKKFLYMTCIICALSTCLLYFVNPGDVFLAIAILAVSNAAFMLSENFCGSFLTDLSTKENMAKISGIGWAIGYFGGLSALIIIQLIVTAKPEDYDSFIHQNQISMIVTGVFVLITAIPTFLFLNNRQKVNPKYSKLGMTELFKEGLSVNLKTLKDVQNYKTLFQFLWSFMFYYAGLSATLSFAGIFARRELNFQTGDLVIMFLCIQLSSALGSFAFGLLERKTGIKNNILITLLLWIISILGIVLINPLAEMFSVEPKVIFFALSLVVGLGVGSTQSSSRALVGMLCPQEKSAEIFGLWGMFNRIAAILAMATFGPVSDMFGIRLACILLLFYFVIGGFLLFRINLNQVIRN